MRTECDGDAAAEMIDLAVLTMHCVWGYEPSVALAEILTWPVEETWTARRPLTAIAAWDGHALQWFARWAVDTLTAHQRATTPDVPAGMRAVLDAGEIVTPGMFFEEE